MKYQLCLVALCGLIERSLAHSTFGHLFVNGTDLGDFTHVLDVAVFSGPGVGEDPWENNKTFPGNTSHKTFPQRRQDILGTNITCGRLAFNSMSSTSIADVVAGTEVGFGVSSKQDIKFPVFPMEFFHPGPAQIYLSRAPGDDLKAYRGDGDWFKIAYSEPLNSTRWFLLGKHEYNFIIPKTTPPGKYLMRMEYFWPHWEANQSQWFINCALLNIMGEGGGTPTGFARFPGTYEMNEIPGILFPKSESGRQDRKNYVPPGPAVWTGQTQLEEVIYLCYIKQYDYEY